MGADFLFAATPRFKPTPERCREIKTFLREYPEDKLFGLVGDYWILGLDEESTAKEIRFRIYEAVLEAAEYETRETSTLRMPGMNFEATITGGMSWGDSPTEAFNILGDLTSFADLWDLMKKFSSEDSEDARSKRNKLIKQLALSYLKANLDDVLEVCVTQQFAEDNPGMMDCCGTTMPTITEEELENLITCGE